MTRKHEDDGISANWMFGDEQEIKDGGFPDDHYAEQTSADSIGINKEGQMIGALNLLRDSKLPFEEKQIIFAQLTTEGYFPEGSQLEINNDGIYQCVMPGEEEIRAASDWPRHRQ